MGDNDKGMAVRDAGALSAGTLEALVIRGDIKALTPAAKVEYYLNLCRSLDLNPVTQPFQLLAFKDRQGREKEQLYAKKDATDQLRVRRGISVTKLEHKPIGDIYTVTAYGIDAKGRTDAAMGAVSIKGLGGDALANAMMKTETKAKRRLTLSLAGLGMLDETEIETIPGRKEVGVIDLQTGATVTTEVIDMPATSQVPKPKLIAKVEDAEVIDLPPRSAKQPDKSVAPTTSPRVNPLADKYAKALLASKALSADERSKATRALARHQDDADYLAKAIKRLKEKEDDAEVPFGNADIYDDKDPANDAPTSEGA